MKRITIIMVCILAWNVAALACKPPDPITGFSIQSVAHNALTVSFDVPARGKVAVRLSPIPAGWGAAKELVCDASPCVIDGLSSETAYDVHAAPFVITKTQGTIYGNPTDSLLVRTERVVTLKEAVHEAVDYCLTRKLAHTACFRALDESLGKVTQ